MKDEEIDRFLTAPSDVIEPSSGFAAAVMEAVRAEAAQPVPIPFPWRRALPAFVLAGAGLLWVLGDLILRSSPVRAAAPGLPAVPAAWLLPAASALAWTTAGLLVAAVTYFVSARLTRSRRFASFG